MNTAAAPRPWSLLHLPNEAQEGDQIGPRQAFTQLRSEGRIDRYSAFSYLVHARTHGLAVMLDELLRRATQMQPSCIVWQHVGCLDVSRRFLERLRAAVPHSHLLYHEGDVYGRWAKPLPPATRRLMAEADTVALVGLGHYERLARRAGARRVLYAPHSVDTLRFGTPWQPTPTREFDVVMIGNCVRTRVPWRAIPGAARRGRLARVLAARFGPRFALYGHGWDGLPGHRGTLPFDQQEAAQRRAWVTVSWDHFDQVERYFSDRVPISLMSGVPHVTNHQPGYEAVFGAEAPLHWAHSVDELVAVVEALLAQGPEALNALGARAQAMARERFTATPVYRRLLEEALSP